MEVKTEAVNVKLKPKHELLDPNFEGYKLNLGKIPIHNLQVKQGVLRAPESDTSYSYQQVRLHALHNHLWQDPWMAGLNFYFSAGSLHAVSLDESPGAASRLRHTAVLQLPADADGDGDGDGVGDGDGPPAHPSLSLVSDRLALLSDGRGTLHVADTGDRQQHRNWQVRCSVTPLSGRGFVLAHSVLDPAGWLQVLTEHVAERETVPEWRPQEKDVTFGNLVTWLTLESDAVSGWRLSRLRQAVTSGTVHYLCLEPGGTALCVAAERPVSLVRDSERPVPPPTAVPAAAAGTETPPDETEPPLYRWNQTSDDVTVHLLTSPGVSSDLRVTLEPHQLAVTAGGETVLEGTLPEAIRRDESTWTLDEGRLELTLVKMEPGKVWPELLTGDRRGRQVTSDPDQTVPPNSMDTSDNKQEVEPDRPGPVVGAEVEDCDDLPEHGTMLFRIDGDTHTVTHEAGLSSHQYLMTVSLSAAESPAFCIRHDVDGLVWQPRSQDDRYECDHVGTLQAFGFVQASKQQRKFMTCAPDLSYAVICETSRHIYIYHQPSAVEGDLRNRKSGRRVRAVSRQQVVSLEDQEPILGVAAAVGCIFVLTAGRLHALVLGGD